MLNTVRRDHWWDKVCDGIKDQLREEHFIARQFMVFVKCVRLSDANPFNSRMPMRPLRHVCGNKIRIDVAHIVD